MRRASIWFALFLGFGHVTTQAGSPCAEGTAVQILGSGDASLSAKRAGSGVLIWIDGKARLLVNTGSGVALRFQESGALWNDLDAIVFTRMDVTHTDDLAALLYAAQASGRTRALPIYGPPGNKLAPSTVTFVRDLFDPVRGAYRQLGSLLAPLDRGSYKLEPHDVREPPASLSTPRRPGPVLLPVFSNEHVQLKALIHSAEPVPVLSWRINVGASGLVIHGNTRSASESLMALLDETSVLVMPAQSVDVSSRTDPASAPVLRARQLVLIGRGNNAAVREDETLAAARKQAAGTAVWADDLACYRL